MLMTNLLNESVLAPLRWLGKFRWITYEPVGIRDGLYSSTLRLTPPKDMPLFVRQFILSLKRQAALIPDTRNDWLYFYGMSKALASGPKLIRPTYEQCVALAHCEANVPFADYEQPYPVVIVELPQQWMQEQDERLRPHAGEVRVGWNKPPQYVVVFHDKDTGYLRTDVVADAARGIQWCNTMSALHRGQTIEEALHSRSPESSPDLERSVIDKRLGINLCLMMTCHGIRDLGPLHPKKKKAGKKKKRAEHDWEQERTKMLARGVNLLEFEQNVVFYQHLRRDDAQGSDDVEPGTHTSHRPHWRRGHFRRVPCGQGRAARKLVFIKPTLVGRQFFMGDVGKSVTTYEIRDARPNDERKPPVMDNEKPVPYTSRSPKSRTTKFPKAVLGLGLPIQHL